MSSFKKLSKSDVSVVPYHANKQWDLSYCPYPTSSEYLTIYKGTNVTGSFNLDEDPVTEGQYERLVYTQINQLFYQEYTDLLDTSSLMFTLDNYESASQYRPTSSYFIYNDNKNLIQNFPTGAMEGIRVLAINQDIYGNKVLPGNFQLSSSAYFIKDDAYGNLFDYSSSKTHVGNIYYAHGLAIITNQDYQMMFPLPPIAKNDSGIFNVSQTPKSVSVTLNDYARSGTLNTSSILLENPIGDYHSWETGSNGTVVLTTTTPGTYYVYYTIGADIAGSCPVNLRSNKARIKAVVYDEGITDCSLTGSLFTSSAAPTCPDQRIVFQICNSNAQKDDNFDIYLNNVYIGAVDLNTNAQSGSLFIADLNTSTYLVSSDFSCSLSNMVTYHFNPAILRETNVLEMRNTQNNNNGNFGVVGVRSYQLSGNALSNPCTIANLQYSGGSGQSFTLNFNYTSCCGNTTTTSTTTTSTTLLPPPTTTSTTTTSTTLIPPPTSTTTTSTTTSTTTPSPTTTSTTTSTTTLSTSACYTTSTGTIPVTGGASSTSTGTITVTSGTVNIWAKYNSGGSNSGTAIFSMDINSVIANGSFTITSSGQTGYSTSNGSTGAGYITLTPGTYSYSLTKTDNLTSGNEVRFSWSTGTDPLSSVNMSSC